MKERILQFGTGNFLRGFFDDFIHILHQKELYDGSVVIVSPTDSSAVEVLNRQHGAYHLVLRGISDGELVETHKEIRCVSRAVNPYRDFAAYLKLAENPALRFIVSNTTEAGIAFDDTCRLEDAPAASFPAKLTQLLWRRFQCGGSGFVLLSCELIDRNADLLREYVLRYAALWQLGSVFETWVKTENTFCNTLVDRIVTGYPKSDAALCDRYPKDALLDTAEPYHFWAIEGDFEHELPLRQAGINAVWCDDITGYKKRKVRLLNGAHTAMVFPALLCGIPTVREAVEDPQLCRFVKRCLYDIALPVLGDTAENRAFADAVLERFQNPFIQHQLTSIALNSVSKYTVRVLPTVMDNYMAHGDFPKPLLLSLAALIRYYKENEVTDSPEHIAFIKTRCVPEILSNKALWGHDLSALCPLTEKYFETENMRIAIDACLSEE